MGKEQELKIYVFIISILHSLTSFMFIFFLDKKTNQKNQVSSRRFYFVKPKIQG